MKMSCTCKFHRACEKSRIYTVHTGPIHTPFVRLNQVRSMAGKGFAMTQVRSDCHVCHKWGLYSCRTKLVNCKSQALTSHSQWTHNNHVHQAYAFHGLTTQFCSCLEHSCIHVAWMRTTKPCGLSFIVISGEVTRFTWVLHNFFFFVCLTCCWKVLPQMPIVGWPASLKFLLCLTLWFFQFG